nr:hypothetical protein [uncultured Albidiferax sp.]
MHEVQRETLFLFNELPVYASNRPEQRKQPRGFIVLAAVGIALMQRDRVFERVEVNGQPAVATHCQRKWLDGHLKQVESNSPKKSLSC